MLSSFVAEILLVQTLPFQRGRKESRRYYMKLPDVDLSVDASFLWNPCAVLDYFSGELQIRIATAVFSLAVSGPSTQSAAVIAVRPEVTIQGKTLCPLLFLVVMI
jgi:hypothetical protein